MKNMVAWVTLTDLKKIQKQGWVSFFLLFFFPSFYFNIQKFCLFGISEFTFLNRFKANCKANSLCSCNFNLLWNSNTILLSSECCQFTCLVYLLVYHIWQRITYTADSKGFSTIQSSEQLVLHCLTAICMGMKKKIASL